MAKAAEGNDRWQVVGELLKGDSAFVMVKDDLGGATKAYQELQKAAKKTEMCSGVMDGKVLRETDLKAITALSAGATRLKKSKRRPNLMQFWEKFRLIRRSQF